MAEMQRRIQELYPETEGHLPEEEREGQTPPAFQKMLRKAEDSGTDDETQLPPRKTTKFCHSLEERHSCKRPGHVRRCRHREQRATMLHSAPLSDPIDSARAFKRPLASL